MARRVALEWVVAMETGLVRGVLVWCWGNSCRGLVGCIGGGSRGYRELERDVVVSGLVIGGCACWRGPLVGFLL